MGVDSSSDKDEGAGDQGIMFGYACTETPELMPAPIYYSHKILELMADGRKNGSMKGLEPDSKSQVWRVCNNLVRGCHKFFLPDKNQAIINDLKKLSELDQSVVFFVSAKKINKIIPMFLHLNHKLLFFYFVFYLVRKLMMRL